MSDSSPQGAASPWRCASTPARGGSFDVTCVGHTEKRSHVEYVFKVRHSCGSEWRVARRYQELHEVHERLSAVFGAAGLPAFPPRTAASAGGVVKGLLGVQIGSEPNIVALREWAFQVYFDALCRWEDVVRTACFQAALGVALPEPVSHLRVRGWLPPDAGGWGAVALLEIRPETPVPESSAGVVEAYHISARLVFPEPLCDSPFIDLREPASSGAATTVRIVDLVPSTQVELEVRAVNAVGRSSPVSIRLQVPPARPGGAAAMVAPPLPLCSAEAGQPLPDSIAESELKGAAAGEPFPDSATIPDSAGPSQHPWSLLADALRPRLLSLDRASTTFSEWSSPCGSGSPTPVAAGRMPLDFDCFDCEQLDFDCQQLEESWREPERLREQPAEETTRACDEHRRSAAEARAQEADVARRLVELERARPSLHRDDSQPGQPAHEAQGVAEVGLRGLELERTASAESSQGEQRRGREELQPDREAQQALSKAAEAACEERAKKLEVENTRIAGDAENARVGPVLDHKTPDDASSREWHEGDAEASGKALEDKSHVDHAWNLGWTAAVRGKSEASTSASTEGPPAS